MSRETYYRDHWTDIESERLERYEEQFVWRPGMDRLLAPAEIAPAQTVADYGCGPGYLAVELARRVGEAGRVHAFDINAEFVARTAERAAAAGVPIAWRSPTWKTTGCRSTTPRSTGSSPRT